MWIVTKQISQKELAETFKTLIHAPDILKIPGTHDGMAAIMAKNIGFQALYLSGAAYTASRGIPDLGLIQSQEMAEKARELVRATNLPVLVDIDTGYGGVLNVARTAAEMVENRIAGVQIEDQQLPKKCGHLNGKKLISAEEMIAKIKMIKKTAPSLVVVARTDAKAVEGIDEAINRANLYVEAGADAIFPEALTNAEEFQELASAVNAPLLANMTEFGKTHYYTAEEFQLLGYSMVIYPVTSLRAAAKAYERVFSDIYQKGTQKDVLHDLQTREQLYDAIHYNDYEELDKNIAKTALPEIGKEKDC
ncbi:methylisocitrate lyase [Bacillus sp. CLL-7-23]|uniref:Methylisocitrate lyase n=1 Tax=Bacillus changyiensis TaxID=3004103 RepID=A0ABT4WYY2_9BACI|nr:methylisocitrate lyase [Bacillus changyiensis]MDA7025250.1 methylisocitrate lyase [Bacillus changyiensis]